MSIILYNNARINSKNPSILNNINILHMNNLYINTRNPHGKKIYCGLLSTKRLWSQEYSFALNSSNWSHYLGIHYFNSSQSPFNSQLYSAHEFLIQTLNSPWTFLSFNLKLGVVPYYPLVPLNIAPKKSNLNWKVENF